MSVDLPVTDWRPSDGNSDFDATGANNIVDTDGNQLVDTVANDIVDTGVTQTYLPATVWSEDDSV